MQILRNALSLSKNKKLAKKTPRLLRSFAQTHVLEPTSATTDSVSFSTSAVATKKPEQHRSLVPGLSAYDSQDVDMDAGNAPGNLSFSTNVAHNQNFSRTSDAGSEFEGSVHSSSNTSCQ